MVDTGESFDLREVLHERLIFEVGRQALASVLAKSMF
jgi:hypothetical protein